MSDAFDKVKGGLLLVIRSMMAPTDYHALYPASVIAQNADKTLELRTESTKLGMLSKVRIKLGIPGATVTLEAGASVLLGFEAGDPSRPVALLWGASTITTLSLNGGSMGLAKADHAHEVTVSDAGTGIPETVTSGPSDSNTTLIKVT